VDVIEQDGDDRDRAQTLDVGSKVRPTSRGNRYSPGGRLGRFSGGSRVTLSVDYQIAVASSTDSSQRLISPKKTPAWAPSVAR
jgi:hypothetical protein